MHEVEALKDSAHHHGKPCRLHLRKSGNAALPLHRVRLHERDDFFAECWTAENTFSGMRKPFEAAHRLHAPTLSLAQNTDLFGKCNNPRGHGHRYIAEATIGGTYDERSGTLYDFAALECRLEGIGRRLGRTNISISRCRSSATLPRPGRISSKRSGRGSTRLSGRLERLRFWETANNRFTLRRNVAG